MKTIIFGNQKGGVLKTTSVYTFADYLAQKKKKKVLMIDLDSQCNLTTTFIKDRASLINAKTCKDVIDDELSIKDVYVKCRSGYIVPGSPKFEFADSAYATEPQTFMALKKALDKVEKEFDFCLIDSPPLITFLFAMGMYASDYIVIPSEIDKYSMDSLGKICKKIEKVTTDRQNKNVIAGILLTKVNKRTNDYKECREVYEEYSKRIGTKVFKTPIPYSTKMATCVKNNMSIFDFAPDSSVAKAYEEFAEELLETVKK